jgi:hypothetical protein
MTEIHMAASWKYSIDGTVKGIPCGETGSVSVTDTRSKVTCTDCDDILAGRVVSPAEEAEEIEEAAFAAEIAAETPAETTTEEPAAEAKSTEDCWIAIYNAAAPGQLTSLSDIQAATGLTTGELERGVRFIAGNMDDVELAPEAHGRRARAMVSVVVGGEARHWVRFAA